MGKSSEMAVCKHCGDVIMYCKCYEDVIKSMESDKKNLLERAIELAVKHHKGQTDKAGKAYILHPLRLMMAVNTNEEKIVAVLHDIVEDTDITLEDLRNEGFSNAIVDAIECVTNRDGGEHSGPQNGTHPGDRRRAGCHCQSRLHDADRQGTARGTEKWRCCSRRRCLG